jgi:hypothetical protein
VGGGGWGGGGNINRDSGEHGVFFIPYHILMYTHTSDSVIWKKHVYILSCNRLVMYNSRYVHGIY